MTNPTAADQLAEAAREVEQCCLEWEMLFNKEGHYGGARVCEAHERLSAALRRHDEERGVREKLHAVVMYARCWHNNRDYRVNLDRAVDELLAAESEADRAARQAAKVVS